MDIARTPATPEGNVAMADAAPEPHEPATIRREDYTPFPWLVTETRLDFELGRLFHCGCKLLVPCHVEHLAQLHVSPGVSESSF